MRCGRCWRRAPAAECAPRAAQHAGRRQLYCGCWCSSTSRCGADPAAGVGGPGSVAYRHFCRIVRRDGAGREDRGAPGAAPRRAGRCRTCWRVSSRWRKSGTGDARPAAADRHDGRRGVDSAPHGQWSVCGRGPRGESRAAAPGAGGDRAAGAGARRAAQRAPAGVRDWAGDAAAGGGGDRRPPAALSRAAADHRAARPPGGHLTAAAVPAQLGTLPAVQQRAAARALAVLETMLPRARQVLAQTRARILRGETTSAGKLVSLFEPSAT